MVGRCVYTSNLIVRTERGLRDALADVARRQNISRSELVRRALRRVVECASEPAHG